MLRAQAEETQEGVATWLRWGANRLRSADPVPVWRDGDVRFAVLPQNVLLPAPGEEGAAGGQNEVAVTIVEIVALGGGAVVWLEPVGLPGERVQMRLPARALRERGLEAGARLAVRIRPEDVVPLGPAAGAA
mgnify:CR=1 FL=1